ncbi:ATP-grasp domain-containing protein [Thioalkalivibrio thiocyanodenitrificans]|uniref:ATP-grasp domain-containing protein n=1 Tax=Thioalkalivibrio thiocyanodenitrificans TaxID=243063 RepID=UPI0003814DD1|nr:ATP-grasp domain-containing protein [Thioalkalivibrio thiocyanodenitrificans]
MGNSPPDHHRDLDLLNPYARIIVDEALRRGITFRLLDPEAGYFCLTHGGRSIVCLESLSELTSAIAMSLCDDKSATLRLLRRAGLRVPEQVRAGDEEANRAFLERHGRIVVKPLRGEQGAGVSVNIHDADEMDMAVRDARRFADTVLLEEHVDGEDLRILVIGDEVVAAAVRRAPTIVGNGHDDIRTLIKVRSREREQETGGESRIPLDHETERCVHDAGFGLDHVLEAGVELVVRDTYNLHKGATIHDVTHLLHPHIAGMALEAARLIDIPVMGLDLLMPDVRGEDYVIIEANERPGLANHAPRPTAQRFIDLLFPDTVQGP